jgi:hypothetical protein
MEFADSTQNPKKIIGTPNKPIKTKKKSKKCMFSTFLKVSKNQKFVFDEI